MSFGYFPHIFCDQTIDTIAEKTKHVVVIFGFSMCLITMDIPLFFTTDGLVFKFTFIEYNHDCGSLYCQYTYI